MRVGPPNHCSPPAHSLDLLDRPGRLGLGAQPAAPTAKPEKKYIKPGESRDAKPDLVLARDADGRQRNVRSLDEKLVQRELQGVHEGKVSKQGGLQVTVICILACIFGFRHTPLPCLRIYASDDGCIKLTRRA